MARSKTSETLFYVVLIANFNLIKLHFGKAILLFQYISFKKYFVCTLKTHSMYYIVSYSKG